MPSEHDRWPRKKFFQATHKYRGPTLDQGYEAPFHTTMMFLNRVGSIRHNAYCVQHGTRRENQGIHKHFELPCQQHSL